MSARQKHDKTYVFSEMPPGRAVAYLVVPTVLMQAIGKKRRPYILAFTRMGTVGVLFMCACNALLGAPGVLFGKPLAEEHAGRGDRLHRARGPAPPGQHVFRPRGRLGASAAWAVVVKQVLPKPFRPSCTS